MAMNLWVSQSFHGVRKKELEKKRREEKRTTEDVARLIRDGLAAVVAALGKDLVSRADKGVGDFSLEEVLEGLGSDDQHLVARVDLIEISQLLNELFVVLLVLDLLEVEEEDDFNQSLDLLLVVLELGQKRTEVLAEKRCDFIPADLDVGLCNSCGQSP